MQKRKLQKNGCYERINLETNESRLIYYSKSEKAKIEQDYNEIRRYGCFYSKARSGFRTKEVKTTTTLQLDANKNEDDNNDDFTNIKQLIIDIDSQDNAYIKSKLFKDETINSKDVEKDLKIYRFKKSFNDFFDNKLVFSDVNLESENEKNYFHQK